MFGFLAGFALLGLATTAWPLYLHLRRRRERRVQTVPSLRLFAPESVRTRRRGVQQLVLLLSRVGILASLSFLVGQPYLESDRELPFPPVSGHMEPELFLGLVVDDSISALHGEEEAGRLEKSRTWLLEQLARLPDTVRISIVTTSHPQPTGFLAKPVAASLLRRLSFISKEGNGCDALWRMAKRLHGRQGALVVAAPLERSIWPFADPRDGRKTIEKIFFFDTTPYRLEAAIRRAAPQVGEVVWLCELAGDQDALVGKRLELKNRDGRRVWKHEISVHEALSGNVVVDMEELPRSAYEISLSGQGASHCWRHYFIAAGSRATRATRAARFALVADDASLGTRIVGATIEALRPEIPKAFVPFSSTSSSEIPDVSAAVIFGIGAVPPGLITWLERQIDAGIHVVCFPSPEDTPTVQADGDLRWERLPGWGEAILLDDDAAPFEIEVAHLPESHRFDELLLGELNVLNLRSFREPLFARRGRSVISTRSGETLLSFTSPNPRSSIWALGAPITMEAESLIYHPLFPLLLDWMLFPFRRPADNSHGSVLVGENANFATWFDRELFGAELVLPSGTIVPLRKGLNWYPVSAAGIYELRFEDRSEYRVANYPRASDSGTLARESWNEVSPARRTVWLSEGEFFAAGELAEISIPAGSKAAERYDLSVLMALLLLTCLAVEAFVLAACWREEPR